MVVHIARIKISASNALFEAAINDPNIIPDKDKGSVRSLAALIHGDTLIKINNLKVN